MGVKFRAARGKWELTYFVDGKRKRLLFDSKELAEANDPKKKQVSHSGTLKLAIHEYVRIFTQRKSKRNDERHYFKVMFNYLRDEHKISSVEAIQLMHLQGLQNHLGKKLANSSVNRYFNTYRHFFNACIDWGYRSDTPAERLKDLPEDKKTLKRKVWSDEQIDAAYEKATSWLKEFIYLVAYTGMRPIEVCRMTWDEHIDFKAGRIRAVTYKGDGSEQSRWLQVTPEMLLMLKKRKLQCRSKWVFPNEAGNMRDTQNVAKCLRVKVCTPLGLKGYTFYGMRHSFATKALDTLKDIKAVSGLLGHTNVTTTEIYARYNDKQLEAAMLKAAEGRNIGGRLAATNLPPDCHQAIDENL